MVRTALSLTALLVLSATLVAADQKTGQKKATPADSSVVVVDPMDLRQPVPNPERELTEKYDGKTVRFTGRVHDVLPDKKTKTTAYHLQKEVKSASTTAKKGAKPKPDVVTVTVYFQKEDKRLLDPKAKTNLTVEGKGEITSDGTLIIRNARVTDYEKR